MSEKKRVDILEKVSTGAVHFVQEIDETSVLRIVRRRPIEENHLARDLEFNLVEKCFRRDDGFDFTLLDAGGEGLV